MGLLRFEVTPEHSIIFQS